MPAAEPDSGPIADAELASLFSDLKDFRRVLLAVSGGPDSTALMVLAHRWRAARRTGPALAAATVDHRLRRASRREAADVAKLAGKLGLPHDTLVWSGKKPKTGLQEAARKARYALLAGLARKIAADAIVTAHTLDDQAETLLMRLARGSGLTGLGGIRPHSSREGIAIARPLLDVPKTRLIATLRAAGIPFAKDPSNADPKYTRVRLRRLAAALAAEGLTSARLATAARRLARADAAIELAASELQPKVARPRSGKQSLENVVTFDSRAFFEAADEISLRLLGRALEATGDEGPVELAKLESLHSALWDAHGAGVPLRRTLAGALVGLDGARLTVTRAPARRRRRR
ncbi:MAG TPA: tRNA lysidine(34) synthetase TilS [Xanthobacteraceae bacterium]